MTNVYNAIPDDAPLKQLSGSKTLFKKQLVRFGDWIDPIYPEDVMRIDRLFLESLVKNYNNSVPGRIPVPLTHTDDPSYNTGELVQLVIEGDGTNVEHGLYGILDIRRPETADDIRNELVFDVSISFTDNYVDNETGGQHGPTLLHVALVNNPYIKKMSPFKALAETLKQQFQGATVHMLSESVNNKETSMSKVKNDREFPVEIVYKLDDKEVKATVEPGDVIDVPKTQVKDVEKAVADAEAPETEEQKAVREAKEAEAAAEAKAELEAQEKGDQNEDESKDLSEAQKTMRELSEARRKLRERDVEDQYQDGLKAGKIVPAQEDAFKALSEALHGQTRQLSDGKTENLSELLAEFVAKAPKVVSLDEEKGKNTDDSDKGPLAQLSEESKLGLAKMRVSEEDFVKYGSKENISINDLGANNG